MTSLLSKVTENYNGNQRKLKFMKGSGINVNCICLMLSRALVVTYLVNFLNCWTS